jgi:ATP-dependent helicase/nuclease subunit A
MGDVPLYEEALARYGIPYRVTSSRTFYRREEVGWLLNVLHAVEHPTDPIAVWGALRSPFFGCSDREVYELVASGGSLDYRARLPWEAPAPAAGADSGPIESIDAAYRVLRGLHRDWHALSVPAMVEEVLARTQARITFLLTPQGEQRVANLTKVVTLARALEESGVLTFRAFVHWLRDMEGQAVDEAESPTVEEGDDVVRLMSIHAAKGLEFPVVVLADLGRGPGGQADPVVLHRLTGRVGVSLGRVEGWAVHTREYEALKDGQARREDAERLRLLYVGMTRARDALVLAVAPTAPERSLMADLREVAPWSATPGAANDGWAVLRAEDFPRLPDDHAVRPASPGAKETPAAPSPAERDSWMAEAASCREAAAEAEEVMHPSHQIDHDALGRLKRQGGRLEGEPGGRRLGTLVHRALALLPPGREDLAEAVVSYVGRQLHASASMTALALAMVRRALSHLAGAGVDEARVWREVPFAAAGEADALVSGAMDLLAALPSGLWVVDYKTDWLPGPSRQVVDAVYRPQMQSYQSAVRRMGVDAQVQLFALDDVYGGNSP